MNVYTIVDSLPDGYRWATEMECECWTKNEDILVQVRRGGTDDAPMTDLAIRVDSAANVEYVVRTSYRVTPEQP